MRRFRFALVLSALLSTATASSFAKKESKPVVTYSGMTVREDRGVTLRVELSHRVPFKTSKAGKHVSYVLEGATVRQRTNLYPLRAEHFDVEVLSTKLDRIRGGVKFSVSLRDNVELKTKLVEHSGGATLLVEVPPKPAPVQSPASKDAEGSGEPASGNASGALR